MSDLRQAKLRLKDRRRRLAWVKVAAGAGVVAIALLLFFYAARLPSVTISRVAVIGANLVPSAAVHDIAMQKLSGSYAYVIPRANALFAPIGGITSAIAAAFPPVAQVSVSRKGFTGLAISVTERQPAALWCSGDAPAVQNATSTACYLMDKNGFVYAPSAGEALLRYYGALAGAPIGRTYLAGMFPALASAVSGIKDSVRRAPAAVSVDGASSDVSLSFAEGGVLRFVLAPDTTSTVQNIASVFASQSFKDHPNFEYVDFRFGDKVYVKFK